MSKKNEQLQKLFKKVTVRVSLPKVVEGMPLLEQGMLAVLVRHMPQEKAESFIAALKKAYPEWNEVRVCQTEEIAAAIRGGKASRDKLSPLFPPARDAREYLQEVFQKTHGMELDSLRDDPAGNAKALAQMPVLGTAATAQVLALANGGKLPIHPPLVRLLERTGVVAKGGLKKAKDLGEFFPEGDNSTLERVGEVVRASPGRAQRPPRWETHRVRRAPVRDRGTPTARAQARARPLARSAARFVQHRAPGGHAPCRPHRARRARRERRS